MNSVEYEVMVSHTTVWKRSIKARSQEHAEELARKEWGLGEFETPDVEWSEVKSVSGQFEIV